MPLVCNSIDNKGEKQEKHMGDMTVISIMVGAMLIVTAARYY